MTTTEDVVRRYFAVVADLGSTAEQLEALLHVLAERGVDARGGDEQAHGDRRRVVRCAAAGLVLLAAQAARAATGGEHHTCGETGDDGGVPGTGGTTHLQDLRAGDGGRDVGHALRELYRCDLLRSSNAASRI